MAVSADIVTDPTPATPRVVELRRRLDEFYGSTTEYEAFGHVPDRSDLYRRLRDLPRAAGAGPMRILELGAGRSDLPSFARKNGWDVEYEAQDVTDANLDYLQPLSRQVHVCDIGQIETPRPGYDLIFSTYVFEHVSAPRHFLENVRRLLRPGGWHVLVCPRYDLPGYVCPSLRHLSRAKQLLLAGRLAAARARAKLDGRERFFVNVDPSVFHAERWYRDSDAVHLVGVGDVSRWHRANGFEVRPLSLETPGWKARLLWPMIRLSLACRLDAAAAA